MTTFTDVIDCSKHLIQSLYCSPHKLCLFGEEAGGMAVAVAVNLQPELFCAAILHSPVVDILTSMTDTRTSVVADGHAEWGNPQIEEHYRQMLRTHSFKGKA